MSLNIDNIHYCCRQVEQYFGVENQLDPDLECPRKKSDTKKLQPIEGAGIPAP